VIKEYTDNSTDKMVDMTVKLLAEVDVEKVLKLTTTMSTSNMNLFDADEHLKKYAEIHDIMDEFYFVRHMTYGKRKVHQLAVLKDTLHKVEQKVKYIRANLSGQLEMRNKKQDIVHAELKALNIDMRDDSYSYLTKMPMDSVTEEKVLELEKEFREIQEEVATLSAMTVEQIWIKELKALKDKI
jgi:DNA topoisomerase-2